MAFRSLDTVFQDIEPELFTFVMSRVRCKATADDLTQELSLRLTSIDSKKIAHAKSYLFRMAANLVADHQRREQRTNRLLETFVLTRSERFDSLTPERVVMARQEIEALTRVVRRMSPTTRKIFKMNRFVGMSQKEIAKSLGVSHTTVEKHIRKALGMLARHRGAGCDP